MVYTQKDFETYIENYRQLYFVTLQWLILDRPGNSGNTFCYTAITRFIINPDKKIETNDETYLIYINKT